MPYRAKKRCNQPGCANLIDHPKTRCDRHRLPAKQNQNRKMYHKANKYFYSSSKWRKFREMFLRLHPLCIGYRHQCDGLATIVDHIVPIADGGAKLDTANCQPLCASCHSRKTQDDIRARGRVKSPNPQPLPTDCQAQKNRTQVLS